MSTLGDWGQKSSNYYESRIDKPFRKATGHDESDFRAKEAESRAVQEGQNEKTKGVLSGMTDADNRYYRDVEAGADRYLRDTRSYGNEYLTKQQGLADEAADQAKNAQSTYSNDIQPRQKGMMEDAQRNSNSAMTLQDAMNPNNKVAQGVRNLYNDEGEAIRKQGLADSGVLAAMGAQATAGQLGGMPVFTGSNLQTLNSQNQRQSGEAYAQAAQRMQALREQGLGKSIDQSNLMYDKGQQAKDRYAGTISDFEGGMDRNLARSQDARMEQQGYAADRMGVQRGMAGDTYDIGGQNANLQHDLSMGQGQREMGYFGQEAAGQQANIANEMGRLQNSGFRGSKQMIPAILGAVMGKGGGGGGGGQQAPVGNQNYQNPSQGGGGVAGGMNTQYSGGSYGPPNQDQYYANNRRQ